MATNIITASFEEGQTLTCADGLWQYDYGQVLRFEGIELPEAYEVHFSNAPMSGETVTQIGNADGVTIPDQFLQTGEILYAWIYLHTGEDDGETEYMVTMNVRKRAEPSDEVPTPVEQSAITQAIAALNIAVEKADEAITHYPKIDNGTWWVWDVTEEAYVNTGVEAQGERGEQGVPGQPGAPGQDGAPGEDGFSPVITVADITGGHRITITDATGTKTVDVMDGEDGQPGQPGATGNGIASITKTGTVGLVDTYTITYTNGTTTTFTVTNGSDATVTVDDELSSTSENPVQNKVINSAISGLIDELNYISENKADIIITSASGNVASFSDGAEYDAVGLVAEFAPVQSGSGDPSPSNVRPINGYTGLDINRTAKNLFDINTLAVDGQITVVNGVATGTARSFRENFNLNDTAMFWWGMDDILTLSITAYRDTAGSSSSNGLIVNAINDDGTSSAKIKFANDTIEPTTKTAVFGGGKRVKRIALSYESVADAVWHITNVQIELGSTATVFEPYNGTTIPVSWQTEAGTVYGGYVDVVRGKVVAEYVFGQWRWGDRLNSATLSNNVRGSFTLGNAYSFIADNISSGKLCNVAKFLNDYSTDTNHFYTSIVNGRAYVFLPIGTSEDTIVQVACKLATPIEYDITPATVKLLKGYNNIWTSAGGNVSVEYKADTKLYIDGKQVDIRNTIAPIEDGATASQAYAIGKFFYRNGSFCKAKTAIASGAEFTLGTNYEVTTVAAELFTALS